MKRLTALLALATACSTSEPAAVSPADLHSIKTSVTYEAIISDLPSDAREVEVWVPLPPETPFQRIENLSIEPAVGEFRRDPEYGNLLFHFTNWAPGAATLTVKVRFDLVRTEEIARRESTPASLVDRCLHQDRLGIIDEEIRRLAKEITQAKSTAAEKARAIYDYVLGTMTYDKEAPGWGRGDTKRAREVCKGNCSDYHALFISLARASGIPSRFHYGFSLKPDGKAGPHCWAEFLDDSGAWVPVDCSEADKDPSRKDYYFGRLSENRVVFTTGRDITLDPPQKGPPLNFLINPYVEVDERPYDKVKVDATYKTDS